MTPTSTPQPVPTVAPPPPSEDETNATLWIIVIALAVVATGIGAGAMIYRARIASSGEPDETPPSGIGPQDEDGKDEGDDYETLTIDVPRNNE